MQDITSRLLALVQSLPVVHLARRITAHKVTYHDVSDHLCSARRVPLGEQSQTQALTDHLLAALQPVPAGEDELSMAADRRWTYLSRLFGHCYRCAQAAL